MFTRALLYVITSYCAKFTQLFKQTFEYLRVNFKSTSPRTEFL